MDWTPVLDALVKAAAVVITAVALAIRPAIIAYVRSKTTAEQRKVIADFARTAVFFAQQTGADKDAIERKAIAIEKFGGMAEEAGLSISVEDMDSAIEAAVGYAKGVFGAATMNDE